MSTIDKVKCCMGCGEDAEYIYYVPYQEVSYVGPFPYTPTDPHWEDRRGHPGIYWGRCENDGGPPDYLGYFPQLRCEDHKYPAP
jgi:hypothetical protein